MFLDNIFVANEKEVLYVLVTILLQSLETSSKILFIIILIWVKANTFYLLFIKSATSFPEIRDGGTPGPGTVNCPVKYNLSTL